MQNLPIKILLTIFTLILIALILPWHPTLGIYDTLNFFQTLQKDTKNITTLINEHPTTNRPSSSCDIFDGEWVPNPEAPYYTNTTCWAIHEHQNCIKYGRPDSEFMKWKWKPNECELPVFDPFLFLEIVRGKSLAFVGDSVARNHMQSLICLLSRVEYPEDVSHSPDKLFQTWKYTTYNFSMAMFWSTHLVKSREADSIGPTGTGLFNLYLDEFDEKWTTQIENFDYVILSAGHWFFRPSVYYLNGQIIGCRSCINVLNVTYLPMSFAYGMAFKTAFKAISGLKSFKGVTFVRTFAPSHFENGLWNEGGNCLRTRPFRSNETVLEGIDLELYRAQLEEFEIVKREGDKKKMKFLLLNATKAMLLRPDGHPSRFGHWAYENVTLYNDCVHWCLPGPIDTLNDFLLEMLRRDCKMCGSKTQLAFKGSSM